MTPSQNKHWKDVSQGWASLSGPCSGLSRRFGIAQGSKVRAINEFSSSRMNDSVGMTGLAQAFLDSSQDLLDHPCRNCVSTSRVPTGS